MIEPSHWRICGDELLLCPADHEPELLFELSSLTATYAQLHFRMPGDIRDTPLLFDWWERNAPQRRDAWLEYFSPETFGQMRILSRMLIAACREEHHGFSIRLYKTRVCVTKVAPDSIELVLNNRHPVTFLRTQVERSLDGGPVSHLHPQEAQLCKTIWTALDAALQLQKSA